MRVSQSQRQEVDELNELWAKGWNTPNFTGLAISKESLAYDTRIEESSDGVNEYVAYKMYDSMGKLPLKVKNKDRFIKALHCKAVLNRHIKQWVEGFCDGITAPFEIKETCEELGLPDWVYKSFESAIRSQKNQEKRCNVFSKLTTDLYTKLSDGK